ncbi:heterokaryon incompatibility protein-domain-containing protein [Sordaria brevicollis]|uniref:Heterokaryon incompatibility protein-domain-containing protein n=1 Tax=Sordaria brevicollis TaxID=83679 RepID=A0AAE0PND2_SORBR|nr:heterokaryon incompatibility protein-domain-containing protein [Sordaria brevicollis]
MDTHTTNDEPPGVRAHVLCEACARIRRESQLISWFSNPNCHEDEPAPTEREDFYHSWNIKGLLDGAASGCHICTLLRKEARGHNWHKDLGFSKMADVPGAVFVELQSPGSGIMAPPVQMTFIIMEINDEQVFAEDYCESQISPNDYSELAKCLRRGKDLDVPVCVFARFSIIKQHDRDMISPQPASSQEYYPTSTGSSDALDLAKAWLDDCLACHNECNRISLGVNGKLPTRLVEINEVDRQFVPRLIITPASASLADIQYCTLSHVWAATVRGPGVTIQLSSDNIERLQQCIPYGQLPQTFQEAMRITRRLGYRYIWIDSLCIIQDPSDTTDFQREAVTMCDVYSNSSCNIAALGLGNDSESPQDTRSPVDFCFTSRNPLEYISCKIAQLNKDEAIYVEATQYTRLPISLQTSPLLSRAWVFQERFLAPRILYFGAEQLYWECRCRTLSESRLIDRKPFCDSADTSRAQFLALCYSPHNLEDYPDSVPRKHVTVDGEVKEMKNNHFKMECVLIKGLSDKIGNKTEVDPQFMTFWHRIIEDYTEAGLTYASDRFIALAGIVKAVKTRRGLTYVAGTWMESWPFDLLWRWGRFAPVSERRVKGPNLPSWSWASTEGHKEFFKVFRWAGDISEPQTTLLQVVGFSCPTFEEQHYGGCEINITVQAFTRFGEVTGPVKHPMTKQMLPCVKFGDFQHDYLNIWWDEEPTEGDKVLVIPLIRWDESYNTLCTAGLILMQDKSTHGENDKRRHKRVGMFSEHSKREEFMIFGEIFDVDERKEICLC